MPRVEDLTKGPSGPESSEIPHVCALQSTGALTEREIASAYKELIDCLEWGKKTHMIQNQIEKSKQFRERFHANSCVERTHD